MCLQWRDGGEQSTPGISGQLEVVLSLGWHVLPRVGILYVSYSMMFYVNIFFLKESLLGPYKWAMHCFLLSSILFELLKIR